jgi:DNA-binding winged helix-turn-helix (wHTH) protein/TolB-like protein
MTGMVTMSAERIQFSDFELDTSSGELNRHGNEVRLQPQPMKVLVLLAKRAGKVVTRDELKAAVWGANVQVDFDNGLNWSVNKIREMLGDDPLNPKFIETIPKKGYRFIAPILSTPCKPVPLVEGPRSRRLPLLGGVATLTIGLLLIGAGFLHQRRPSARPKTVVVLPFDNLTGSAGQDVLATAATDQVITGIGSQSGLNVIDRATATKLKRTEECIIHIGEQLRADFVVEGSLVGPPEAPLVTAGIYRVRDNTKLWAGQIPTGTDRGMSAYQAIAAKVGQIAE